MTEELKTKEPSRNQTEQTRKNGWKIEKEPVSTPTTTKWKPQLKSKIKEQEERVDNLEQYLGKRNQIIYGIREEDKTERDILSKLGR